MSVSQVALCVLYIPRKLIFFVPQLIYVVVKTANCSVLNVKCTLNCMKCISIKFWNKEQIMIKNWLARLKLPNVQKQIVQMRKCRLTNNLNYIVNRAVSAIVNKSGYRTTRHIINFNTKNCINAKQVRIKDTDAYVVTIKRINRSC